MDYIPTIGLEIHAELKTKTKMFCDSLNDPDEHHPNTNICPICTGQPGTLPTINRHAVELMIQVGIALGGKIAGRTKFDRKNYFYPDLPKGYQISQYDEPIVLDGMLNGVRVKRVHLEEDAGSLVHKKDSSGKEVTLVDYNRAGRPLMELVTEPDIKTAKQASQFAADLRRILRYLGASDADMEKGQMRIEANISLRKNESDPLGTKVEVKNINSFKAAHDAIEYELNRQKEVLESRGRVVQETRGWDDVKRKTVSQRLKEEAHDYRYFPEPDLPPMDLYNLGIDIENIRQEFPEMPQQKSERFMREYELTREQADLLVDDKQVAEYFEDAISELGTEEQGKTAEARKLLFNYFVSDLWGLLKENSLSIKESKVTPENFADLIMLVVTNQLSSRSAKDILRKMNEDGSDPREIMQREGLEQLSDNAVLERAALQIIAENPKPVEDFKKGKLPALQALIGKSMALLKGRGNPALLQEIFKKLLS